MECKNTYQLTTASSYLSMVYESGKITEHDNDELSKLIVSLYREMDYDSKNQFGKT